MSKVYEALSDSATQAYIHKLQMRIEELELRLLEAEKILNKLTFNADAYFINKDVKDTCYDNWTLSHAPYTGE